MSNGDKYAALGEDLGKPSAAVFYSRGLTLYEIRLWYRGPDAALHCLICIHAERPTNGQSDWLLVENGDWSGPFRRFVFYSGIQRFFSEGTESEIPSGARSEALKGYTLLKVLHRAVEHFARRPEFASIQTPSDIPYKRQWRPEYEWDADKGRWKEGEQYRFRTGLCRRAKWVIETLCCPGQSKFPSPSFTWLACIFDQEIGWTIARREIQDGVEITVPLFSWCFDLSVAFAGILEGLMDGSIPIAVDTA